MFNIVILCIAGMLAYVSKEMVFPILPLYLTTNLGITPAITGLMEGIAKSISSIIKFYSGYISDKKNKHKFLIILGYIGALLQKIFIALSNTWAWIVWAKVIDKFGKAFRLAPTNAIIATSSPKNKSGAIFGIQKTFEKLGATIGITVSYILITKVIDMNYKSIFLVSIIPITIATILLFFIKQDRDKLRQNIDLNKLSSKMKLYFFVVFLSSIGNSTETFLLLKASHSGFSASNVLLLYLIATISTFLFAYCSGKLCDLISSQKILCISHLLFGIAYLGIANNLMYISFVLYGIYIALISTSAKIFIMENTPKELLASSLGMNECLIGFASLPATIIAGYLWQIFDPSLPFYFSSTIAFLSALILFIGIKKNT